MSDPTTQVEIPARALFKAAEVCEILNVQPYVLRSWEAEFPDLGVSKSAGSARVYRRKDVEQVARIKHLLLVEGLTLAGARRKLEEDGAPVAADPAAMEELMGRNARERLTAVKRGLRSILELLGAGGGAFRPPAAPPAARLRSVPAGRNNKTSRGKPAASPRHASTRASHARRKRSA
jgi:DNA-binding transcriptional MerR regulator